MVSTTPLKFGYQDILNKIEFFPIKCRIQNASENFHKYQEDLEADKESWWSSSEYMSTQRTKVLYVAFFLFDYLSSCRDSNLLFNAARNDYEPALITDYLLLDTHSQKYFQSS